MFGGLRLLLAMMVCLSHISLSIGGYNPGVAAVVVFYLLAGYVTRALIEDQLRTAPSFYLERLIRLAPPYWGAMAVAMLVWIIIAPSSQFLQRNPGAGDWLANLTILPLNYFMWTRQDQFTLIPPAWSLAVEVQFYLLAPWLLRFRRLGYALALLSLCLYLLAAMSVVNTDWWGYRLLPGVLFMFMIGATLQSRPILVTSLTCFVSGALLIFFLLNPHKQAPFNIETAIGLFIGTPVLAILAHLRRHHLDDMVGRIAYPVFLLHFAVLWCFEALGWTGSVILATPVVLASYIAMTLIVSTGLYALTELPFAAWRRRLRSIHATDAQDRSLRRNRRGNE
jgi:peptidoglycan/LPS O-acetylase OafA/YrhL